MTRKTNARLAGFTYLAYIAVAYPGMVMMSRATKGPDIAAKLTTIAQHSGDVQLSIVLSFLSSICAVILAVALYAITRDEDKELALIGLSCRVAEGITAAFTIPLALGVLSIAKGSGSSDAVGSSALADFLLKAGDWGTLVAASFFAVGSTFFCYLLFRGRIVPAPLAALGLVGSFILAVGLPAEMGGYFAGSLTDLMWLPVAGFEIIVAFWLIIKGAAIPRVAKPASEYEFAR